MSDRPTGLWLCVRLAQLAREASPRSAMERLAAWAYQWSSLIHYQLQQQPLLWLELGASARLFGGHAALIAQLESGLSELGYEHCCALAPSPTAAALLTRAEPPRCVSTRAQLHARLEPLPLTLLALPDEVLAALHSAGLRRIGEVLALPAAAIARRFGPDSSLYLRRLCARAPDPRAAWPLPASYHARCEFDGEVHDVTALLFPLRRLLLEFQGYLRGRDCAVLRFTLHFEHHRAPPSSVTIGLSAPARDAAQFLLLARERLHSLTLAAPVLALSLEALEFTAASVVQADFFGSDEQQLQQLQLLLDRLQARLGEQQVQGLQLQADYRPERAWQLAAPQQPPAPASIHDAARPCTLLREPRRIEPPARLLSGPERIESGWWDGADAQRDYYVAHAADGARLWVFHDLTRGAWYLQGLWT
ncbi:MAG TPA: DNA polymerase Y family protein [Steroidobacteraceae bacterium]|jgi:protein ImuB